MGDYILLERFDEAKAVVRRASTQELEHPPIHQRLLILAYTEGDIQAAAKEVQWFTGRPEESQSLALQARNAYNSGQRRKAKELYSRARELLQRRNPASTAATIVVDDAVSDAVLGNCGAIHDAYKTAGLPSLNREPSPTAVLGLAFCGEAAQAQKIADKVSKQFTMDTLWNSVKAPSIQAAVELGRGQPAKAIELLRSAAPYERRYPYVMYLRGLAYLEAHEGVKAGVEFHKILDHKGAYWMFVSAGPGRLAVAVLPGLPFGDGKFVCNCGRVHQDSDPRGRTYAAERETAPPEFGNPKHRHFIERGSGDRNGVRHIGTVRK